MKGNWFSILVIAILFGLLVLLAGLQYKWVGQIGDSEKVRLSARLKDDTRRFAEDFDREIQSIYFSFQLDPENIEKKDWRPFTKRFVYWKSQTKLPDAVKDFYFVRNDGKELPLQYEKNTSEFQSVTWTDMLKEINDKVSDEKQIEPVFESNDTLALITPVYEKAENQELIVFAEKGENPKLRTREVQFPKRNKFGFLVIVLNESVIREKLLTGLASKYFASGEDSSYNFSVTNSNRKVIFEPQGKAIISPDATTKIFNLQPRDFAFFPAKTGTTIIESNVREDKDGKVVVRETYKSERPSVKTENDTVDVTLARTKEKPPEIAIFKGEVRPANGFWTIYIQHTSGSIDAFIAGARTRNLVISFGILTLLALSMLLIFVVSQRAKRLAQRQVDFVSSVTHEFRTPLSVIYSAGENLSDGVIDEKEGISRYGNLIKNEGKKLSEMVEQILEFAGAKSGTRKFDIRSADAKKIIDDALAECSHTIRNAGFVVETSVPVDLPKVKGDEKALTQAVQNIINNSLKYSNGNKWIKITAVGDSRWVRITVEDKGIGISTKDQKQLFEPFYRSESVVDEQISGNGLGLSLVKQIVDGHEGKIEVESELGKGSKFVIILPANGAGD